MNLNYVLEGVKVMQGQYSRKKGWHWNECDEEESVKASNKKGSSFFVLKEDVYNGAPMNKKTEWILATMNITTEKEASDLDDDKDFKEDSDDDGNDDDTQSKDESYVG